MKLWVGEIELREPVMPFGVPAGYGAARILVRVGGMPLGWIDLGAKPKQEAYTTEEILEVVGKQFQREVVQIAFCNEFVPEVKSEAPPSPISIVICTRDRAEYLDECLRQIAKLDYEDFEVIVVDNASRTQDTRDVVAKYNARYVWEPRPGLDWARNRGIAEAVNEIVAFIDDDARADRGWLRAINGAFARPEVKGVTGMVAPQELETEAQIYFEYIYGGMGKGFQPCTYHRGWVSDELLLWASGFGVGANMAFRRSVFSEIGGFDPALDVGTDTRGGGDVEMFHRLVARGHSLRYEPQALVWHVHRRDFPGLERQINSNGYCVIPYLLTCVRNKTITLTAAAAFFFQQTVGWWMLGRLIRPGKHRRRFVLSEAAGLPCGFLAYWKARREAARLAKIELNPAGRPEPRLADKALGEPAVKCDLPGA